MHDLAARPPDATSRRSSGTSGRTCSPTTGTRPRPCAGCSLAPDRTIGEALRDQRCVAGIGNLYLSETLFLSGVDPWRPVGDVRDLADVVERARRLMGASVAHVGTDDDG